MPFDGLTFDLSLYFVESLVENDSIFEIVRDLFSQVGEIGGIESSLNDIFLFAVILKEGRVVRLAGDIAMLRWDKIDMTE